MKSLSHTHKIIDLCGLMHIYMCVCVYEQFSNTKIQKKKNVLNILIIMSRPLCHSDVFFFIFIKICCKNTVSMALGLSIPIYSI